MGAIATIMSAVMESERTCDNCRFSTVYGDGSTLGCVRNGTITFPGETCDLHWYKRGSKNDKTTKNN